MQWDTRVASLFIPGVLQRFLSKMDNTTGGRNATYARIGRFQPSVMPPAHPTKSFELGQFIMKNIPINPELRFLVMQKGRDYNETEMRGLYEAFADSVFSLSDIYNFQVCFTNFRSSKCAITNYLAHYSRLLMAQQAGNLPPEEAKMIDSEFKEVHSLISNMLCPNKNRCFPFNQVNYLILSFFFGQSVLPLVMANSMEKSFVFTKRSQKELALGYTDPYYYFYPGNPDGIPVSGYLVHDVDVNATRQRGEAMSFYTCSASRDKSFSWAGESKVVKFGGQSRIK